MVVSAQEDFHKNYSGPHLGSALTATSIYSYSLTPTKATRKKEDTGKKRTVSPV
jgi:hypothetical protein